MLQDAADRLPDSYTGNLHDLHPAIKDTDAFLVVSDQPSILTVVSAALMLSDYVHGLALSLPSRSCLAGGGMADDVICWCYSHRSKRVESLLLLDFENMITTNAILRLLLNKGVNNGS
jgi:hypothetical protein